MSVINALRQRLRPAERSLLPGYYTMSEYASWRGYANGGTIEQTLRNAASWACIDVLADSIARTPFDVVRYQGTVRVPVEPTPSVVARPSGVVRQDVWRTQLALSLVTDGNAFGQVVASDRAGYPTQIELLDPLVVGQRDVRDGRAYASVNGGKQQALYPFGPVWHVTGRMVLPGTPFGLSPVKYASKTIGTTLAVEDFSNRFFTDGGHPTKAIYSDKELDETQANSVKAAYQKATRGNREPAVFGSGLKIETLQTDPGATQFIELWRFEVEQACRFWRVPPSMVYAATSGQNVTYANVTQADLHYLKHSLDGYYVRVENAWTDTLPRPQVVRANRNAILRADVQARYQAYEVALRNKFATVNEVRSDEDEAPFPDPEFDKPGVPGAAVPPPIPGENNA